MFVLTHHEREPVEMAGGTTFHFVTDGFDAAYARAVEAAGDDGEVLIAGAPRRSGRRWPPACSTRSSSTSRPMLLGAGERLFDGVADPGLTPVEVIESPMATHIRYRIGTG